MDLLDCKVGNMTTNPQDFNYILVTGQVTQGAKKFMGIVFSTNGGTSWTPTKINDKNGSLATVAAIAPGDANILYVGGCASGYHPFVYKSTNGGVHWTAITNGISSPPLAIAVDPRDSNIVYAGTYYDVWRSLDGGTSWTKSTFPTNSCGFRTLAIDKDSPNRVSQGSTTVFSTARTGA
jgi:photosystem II stability/assembly factor-like uncharacterized protein